MKENDGNNAGIPIELMKIVEAGRWMPVSKKISVSLEGLEIVTCLIRKDSTDKRKHGMEDLLLITYSMRICTESSDMESRAFLCFGRYFGSNMEVLGSIRVDVFYIVLIGRVDDNKDFFKDEDYNKPIYNFYVAEPAKSL